MSQFHIVCRDTADSVPSNDTVALIKKDKTHFSAHHLASIKQMFAMVFLLI